MLDVRDEDVDGDLLVAALTRQFPALHDLFGGDRVVSAGHLLTSSLELQKLQEER